MSIITMIGIFISCPHKLSFSFKIDIGVTLISSHTKENKQNYLD